MESRRKSERELESCIDSMVEEMNGIYCADLTEEAKIDSKMSDIKLREELISQIKQEVRCRKISERIIAEQGREIIYLLQVRVSGTGISYTITRDETDEMPSE